MNKKIHTAILTVMLFIFWGGYAQVHIYSKMEEKVLMDKPLETAYVHTNRNNFFPGEYMLFKVYCINMQTYQLSKISKVAYVKLIGENGLEVFSQKIRLDNGLGQGDFFFNSTIPSGSYKLIAFTNWMKNAGSSQFFMEDIVIVNPYKNDQSPILANKDQNAKVVSIEQNKMQTSSSGLSINLDNKSYGTRQHAQLTLSNNQGMLGYGNYSLSIAHIDKIPSPKITTSENFTKRYPDLMKSIPQRIGDTVAFPEQRGELISGQIFNATTNLPVADANVAISLPGDYFQLNSATTHADGKFYAYADAPYNGETAIVEVVKPTEVSYRFETYNPAQWKADLKEFFSFKIDTSMRKTILNRSIYNQIENSYYQAKPDTILQWKGIDPYTINPFYGESPIVYDLDEYTRFSTLKETLVEFIEHVWVKQINSGEYSFWVRAPLTQVIEGVDTTDPPFVTIDGILIPDQSKILDFNARRIKYIKILRQPYTLEGKDYQGMVAIETIDGNYIEEWKSDEGAKIPFHPPTMQKNYFKQGISINSHIPDYRYQLVWEPHIVLDGSESIFDFYTSEVTGKYEIRLEGFTNYGKPISLISYFEVE